MPEGFLVTKSLFERLDMKIRHIMATALLVSCFGCATLSKNECLQADWFEIGRRDGTMGNPRAVFQKHHEACIKHGAKADRDAYYAGRTEGLKSYCTEESGFEQGRRGRTYKYVCPSEMESKFLTGYARGKELYKIESKIASLERRLKRIEKEIKMKEKKLYSSKLSDEMRNRIRSDIKALDLEYRDAARELKYLEKSKPMLSS
jgi:hypothetical protein